jgi:hypothetical protein
MTTKLLLQGYLEQHTHLLLLLLTRSHADAPLQLPPGSQYATGQLELKLQKRRAFQFLRHSMQSRHTFGMVSADGQACSEIAHSC